MIALNWKFLGFDLKCVIIFYFQIGTINYAKNIKLIILEVFLTLIIEILSLVRIRSSQGFSKLNDKFSEILSLNAAVVGDQ